MLCSLSLNWLRDSKSIKNWGGGEGAVTFTHCDFINIKVNFIVIHPGFLCFAFLIHSLNDEVF